MEPDLYANCLRDVATALSEDAVDAWRDARQASGDAGDVAFRQGIAQGYYNAVSTMLTTITSFGIATADLGVTLDPDRDLLGGG